MGALFSCIASNASESRYTALSRSESYKRQRLLTAYNKEESSRLIPFLPDEVSIHILARLPRMSYYNARSVSRRWRAATMSPELYSVRRELGITEEWLYVLAKADTAELMWFALDPLSNKWLKLPPMPNISFKDPSPNGPLWNLVGPTMRIANTVRSWLGNGASQLASYGCSIGAVDGRLYVLGGFSRSSTMSCVWQFDPMLNEWSEVSSMSTGRAYGKIGILNNKLYVVGGVCRGRGGFIPLESAEVYDPLTGAWSQVPNMPFTKARDQPAMILADMLKPIATGTTSYMGKLCVPQSLYSWPFIVDVGGEMYDPETNSWVEMPNGMGEGWPARQAGTKLSIVVDGELYALDPSGSVDSGKIKVYDKKEDEWKVAISKVPLSDMVDSESPHLLAGFHGKLHVVTKDADSQDISVLQAEPRGNVDSPSGSSSSFFSKSLTEYLDLQTESDTVDWKVVSSKSFGASELLGCIVLDL